MKKIIINIIINIIGALACFVIFAFDAFLSKIVDNSTFLFPWWIWGLIGVVAFEIVYFILVRKRIIVYTLE